MSWLPRNTSLGSLTLIETYEFYDGPRFFSCQSATGQKYLATWIEEMDTSDLWLYLPVSEQRFRTVRSGGISPHTAFKEPESPVFVIEMPTDGDFQDRITELRHGADIPEEWLPENGYYLDLKTDTAPPAIPGTELAQLARQQRRPLFRIEVDPSFSTRTTAPTRAVGNLLNLTQNLLDNVGQSVRAFGSDVGQRGRIPNDILSQTASEIVSLSAASVVIDIGSTGRFDLFGSVFEEAAKTIVDTLAMDEGSNDFRQAVRSLTPRAAKSFRTFVSHVARMDGPAVMALANDDATYHEARLSKEKLVNMVETVNDLTPDEEEEPIRARIFVFRADTKRNTFAATDTRTGETISGFIDEAAQPKFGIFPLSAEYDAIIAVSRVTDEITNEVHHTYRLLQITPPSD